MSWNGNTAWQWIKRNAYTYVGGLYVLLWTYRLRLLLSERLCVSVPWLKIVWTNTTINTANITTYSFMLLIVDEDEEIRSNDESKMSSPRYIGKKTTGLFLVPLRLDNITLTTLCHQNFMVNQNLEKSS